MPKENLDPHLIESAEALLNDCQARGGFLR